MLPVQKKRKVNPMLMKVIFISIGLHVIAGFIATIITVANIVIVDDAQFEEPPAVEEVEPPKEVKVVIKPPPPKSQQQKSLSMRPVANIAVANVDVNLPDMNDSFTVSAGLGGIGGGSLLGGARGSIGMGLSDVSVFGLKTRAERILFVIDANRQMLTDEKGGVNSYQVIKDEITDMVGNFSAGTLFNVMLADRNDTLLFKPQLTAAGADVHQELIKWFAPINRNPSQPGLEGVSGASQPELLNLKDNPINEALVTKNFRGNDTAFMTQTALEQGVDAIFFITGYHRGFEEVHRDMNARELADWEKKISDPKYQAQYEIHQAEKPKMERRIEAKLKQINEERAKKGMPPRVIDLRHGVYTGAKELDLKWVVDHPGHKPAPKVDPKEIEKYFRELNTVLFDDRDKTVPSVNVVLFLANDEEFKPEDENRLKDYVRFYRGKYRVIRGENEIKSARSASETVN